jgi:hypothetical protein
MNETEDQDSEHSNGSHGSNGYAAHVVETGTSIESARDGTDTHAEIVRFCTREMGRGPVHRFAAIQVGYSESTIGDWSDLGGRDPESIASEIYERIKEDARGQTGLLRYIVAVYRAEGKPHAGRKWLTMQGGASEFQESFDVQRHPPTNQGVVGQLMEHEHSNHALSFKLVTYMISILQRRIQDLERQNERLMTTHTRTVEAHERLVNESHRRDMDLRKVRFDELKSEKLFDQIMLIAPLIFRYAVGDKSAVMQLAGLESQLHNLIGSFTPDQLRGLLSTLNPAQSASFMQLAQTLAASKPAGIGEELAKKEEEEKARAAAEAATSHLPSAKT